jgi:hypothetical protein
MRNSKGQFVKGMKPMKYWLGKKMSDEHKKKIGEAHKGKKKPPFSSEWRIKQSNSHKGQHSSPLTEFKKGERVSISTEFKKGMIPWNKGLRGYKAGDKNNMWKGGITPENQRIRTSTTYKEWRKKVFERDDYRCFDCGVKSGEGKKIILHADHIYPFSLFPRLRFDINNGRTLCRDCHKRTETYGVNLHIKYATIF